MRKEECRSLPTNLAGAVGTRIVDGATHGRGKSGKGGGIGPGASPMSIVGRLFLLLVQATDCAHKRGGLLVASPSSVSGGSRH